MKATLYVGADVAIDDDALTKEFAARMWRQHGLSVEATVKRDGRLTGRRPLVVIDGATLAPCPTS